MTPQERRLYVDTQWPADIQAQKAIVFNMWKPVIGYLDLNATFNPPAQCRAAQIQYCNAIRYNLQTSFVLALDACVDIRVGYEEKLFEYWRDMPTFANFPQFPPIEMIPVAATVTAGSRKRRRADHPNALLLPEPVPAPEYPPDR
jgi:hypothetical protein